VWIGRDASLAVGGGANGEDGGAAADKSDECEVLDMEGSRAEARLCLYTQKGYLSF
jgi:hypothetical protein